MKWNDSKLVVKLPINSSMIEIDEFYSKGKK